jgi:hypothetical protein
MLGKKNPCSTISGGCGAGTRRSTAEALELGRFLTIGADDTDA